MMTLHASELNCSPTQHPLLSMSAPDPVLPAVDMTVLAGFEELQLPDEPDLIVELIDLYLVEAADKIAAMQAAAPHADAAALRRAAHSLKGSSANLGVQQVTALCAALEQTDCAASFQRATTLINALAAAFAHAQQILIAERHRREPSGL